MQKIKKNFLKVPKNFTQKISLSSSSRFIVSVALNLKAQQIKGFEHLGLSLKGNILIIDDEIVIPKVSQGRYSKYNTNGKEIIRKDLPMLLDTFSWESPNFGDYSNGTHTCSYTRDVYQREYWEPRCLGIKIEQLSSKYNDSYLVKFTVDYIIDKNSSSFDEDLLFCCNLLQENVGVCSIYTSNASDEEYYETIKLNWDIFPPGEMNIDRLFKKFNITENDYKKREEIVERYEAIKKAKPVKFIQGIGHFSQYFGAILKNGLVVFENLKSGNALYIVLENWEKISQMPRTELLKMDPEIRNFKRIIHSRNWQNHFFKSINQLAH